MLIMSGPGIRQGTRVTRASVLDIAPTVLALLDLPVARYMEGAILQDAFTEDFLSAFPPKFVDSYHFTKEPDPAEDPAVLDSETREKLRALGYLD